MYYGIIEGGKEGCGMLLSLSRCQLVLIGIKPHERGACPVPKVVEPMRGPLPPKVCKEVV